MPSYESSGLDRDVDRDVDFSQRSSAKFQKMLFIMNALEKGWSVKKSQDSYIFTKKHENRREIFQENYLETFIHSNFDHSVLR